VVGVRGTPGEAKWASDKWLKQEYEVAVIVRDAPQLHGRGASGRWSTARRAIGFRLNVGVMADTRRGWLCVHSGEITAGQAE
jgi:hypothetical protein